MCWEMGKEKRLVEIRALVTEISSGTVVIHWMPKILAQGFMQYQPGFEFFSEGGRGMYTCVIPVRRQERALSRLPPY